MLCQMLRMLKSGDKKTLAHISYWMGELLGALDAGLDLGVHSEVVPVYFEHLADL